MTLALAHYICSLSLTVASGLFIQNRQPGQAQFVCGLVFTGIVHIHVLGTYFEFIETLLLCCLNKVLYFTFLNECIIACFESRI